MMEFPGFLKEYSVTHAIKAMTGLLPRLSDNHILKLTNLAEKIVANPAQKERIEIVRKKFQEGHPSLEATRRIIQNVSPKTRDKIVRNLFVNAMFSGTKIRTEIAKKEGWKPPFFLVLSPTMRCNLSCIGCYAGEYSKKDFLTTEDIDRIFSEAKSLGMYFITISGGEPFMRKDLPELWKKHNDMFFLVYTNGLLINDRMAKTLGALGNVAPAVSVEGFQEMTDKRRGTGVFEKVLKTWKRLHDNGVLFGFSATCTRENYHTIYSDEFVDFIIEQGALFGWYFQYIPIGKNPDVTLMTTPQQREYARRRIEEIRETKPIVLADFWNDGHLAGGCIAGGRVYFHINVNGEIEPCVFTHFAVDRIKDSSLRKALNSTFFKSIRKRQPYSPNLMCPCMIIDNPEVLRAVVREGGAHSTHPGAESIIEEIGPFLDEYAKEIHRLWDPIWKNRYQEGKKLFAIDDEIATKLSLK
jgi:MoaA/NifB/PqqE/SkfB family radical SAM enzyme